MASERRILGDRITITGGTHLSASTANVTQNFNPVRSRTHESKAFKTLVANVAPRALHDSGELSDPPKCHPGTRVDVIDVLITWAMCTIYAFPIRWLNGPAGAGKSAIMRTLADMLAQTGLLLASFFFFRSDGSRNTATRLVSTIAYQLCLKVPPLRPHIERAIDLNPLVLQASLPTQIQTLVVDPFLRYFYNPDSARITPLPRIILIDGLDECEGHETQNDILTTLCQMLKTLPIPLAIVVASRPEHQIRIAFELGALCETSSRITLDDSFNPDKDIRIFYKAEFSKIQKTHPMRSKLDQNWPTAAIITKLVLNASGQFIYAATIIRFIKSLRHHPATRLQIILGLADRGTSKPFQQLDLLYTIIFLNVDPDALPDTLQVLGVIFTNIPSDRINSRFQSPGFLDHLLNFSPGHVQSVLLDLESLLTVTSDEEDIEIFHNSLGDFLFDKSRAGDFFIDRGLIYAEIACICIKSFNFYLHHCVDVLPTMVVDIAWYIIHQSQISLQNAAPTDSLRQCIVNLDITKKIAVGAQFSQVYGAWIPALLEGLKKSHFFDADELCHPKVALFRDIVNPILADHWLRRGSGSHTFHATLLMVLVLALTGVDDLMAICFLQDVWLLHGSFSVSIFPGIKHLSVGRVEGTKDYNHCILPKALLGAIDSCDGLLHQPEGQAGCSDLTVHLLRKIWMTPFLHRYQTLMDALIPFLLNASIVQEDLTEEAKRIQCKMPRDGGYFGSNGAITHAINQYIERAEDKRHAG